MANLNDLIKGNIIFKAYPSTKGSSAAALNAAAAGSYTVSVNIQVQDSAGNVQSLIDGFSPLTLTAAHTGVSIASPSLSSATPVFNRGVANVVLTYATGGTNSYAIGNTVGFTVATANIVGYTPTITNAAFTDTIVA